MANPADIALRKAASLEPLGNDDAYALTHLDHLDLSALSEVASAVRTASHGTRMTYSPKVFLPVTNLCRDRCTYCTFRRDPGSPGEWTMTPQEIADCSRRGRSLGCSEALLCLGDKPEVAFRGFLRQLDEYGVNSTAEYVRVACEVSLGEGLLPHTNAGLLSREEMAMLRPWNVSMGLMLENISPRLRDRGMPHHHAPDKDPVRRMRMIDEAGELQIPFTTGILVGIGETEPERIGSLLAIARSHARHGHIQEVIIQNFRAKPATKMADAPDAEEEEFLRILAMARLILPGDIHLQAPPNLSPGAHRRMIRAGIDDWGGISPLTEDYVNPEAAWPAVRDLDATCSKEGFELAPRLPVYPEFVSERFQDEAMLKVLAGYEQLPVAENTVGGVVVADSAAESTSAAHAASSTSGSAPQPRAGQA